MHTASIVYKQCPPAQGLLFYNAALSVPLLAVAVAVSNEPALIQSYPLRDDKGFQVCSVLQAATLPVHSVHQHCTT